MVKILVPGCAYKSQSLQNKNLKEQAYVQMQLINVESGIKTCLSLTDKESKIANG